MPKANPNEEVVIITYDMDEGVQIETQGFTGKACLDATADLKKALGVTVKETPTAEMKAANPTSTVRAKTNVKHGN